MLAAFCPKEKLFLRGDCATQSAHGNRNRRISQRHRHFARRAFRSGATQTGFRANTIVFPKRARRIHYFFRAAIGLAERQRNFLGRARNKFSSRCSAFDSWKFAWKTFRAAKNLQPPRTNSPEIQLQPRKQIRRAKSADGFIACAILFCAAPLGILGAVTDGLSNYFYLLAVKAVMDGLAMTSFVKMFRWPAAMSAFPVFLFFGVITVACQFYVAPFLDSHGLTDSVNTVAGFIALRRRRRDF